MASSTVGGSSFGPPGPATPRRSARRRPHRADPELPRSSVRSPEAIEVQVAQADHPVRAGVLVQGSRRSGRSNRGAAPPSPRATPARQTRLARPEVPGEVHDVARRQVRAPGARRTLRSPPRCGSTLLSDRPPPPAWLPPDRCAEPRARRGSSSASSAREKPRIAERLLEALAGGAVEVGARRSLHAPPSIRLARSAPMAPASTSPDPAVDIRGVPVRIERRASPRASTSGCPAPSRARPRGSSAPASLPAASRSRCTSRSSSSRGGGRLRPG